MSSCLDIKGNQGAVVFHSTHTKTNCCALRAARGRLTQFGRNIFYLPSLLPGSPWELCCHLPKFPDNLRKRSTKMFSSFIVPWLSTKHADNPLHRDCYFRDNSTSFQMLLLCHSHQHYILKRTRCISPYNDPTTNQEEWNFKTIIGFKLELHVMMCSQERNLLLFTMALCLSKSFSVLG